MSRFRVVGLFAISLFAILGGLVLAQAQAGARVDTPQGALLQTQPSGLRSMSVTGWAADSAVSTPLQVQILVNGTVRTTVTANLPRAGAPANGFAATIAAPGQPSTVCAQTASTATQAAVVVGCARPAFAVSIGVVSQAGSTTPAETATFYWVTSSGTIAKPLVTVPIVNGVALYSGESAPHGALWAITVRDANSLPLFRSGPLAQLPGPPSSILPTPHINIFRATTPASFGLNSPDGAPGLVLQQLQMLPSALHATSVRLSADSAGHEIVIVQGQLKLGILSQSFVYTQTLSISPGSAPGHPAEVVTAYAPGPGTFAGANLSPFRTVLDQAITTGVQQALDAAVSGIASLELQSANAGFPAKLVSVTSIQIHANGSNPTAVVVVHGGAISGGLPTVAASK